MEETQVIIDSEPKVMLLAFDRPGFDICDEFILVVRKEIDLNIKVNPYWKS